MTWHGEEGDASCACPSGTLAVAHESFTSPPEIQVGRLGQWHDLTRINAGLVAPFTVQSLAWQNEGFDVQGWLLLPEHTSGKSPTVTVGNR